MKSVEFCYWLQGLFELESPKELNRKQTAAIKAHLSMVFAHEIDPSYPNGQQKILTKLHNDGATKEEIDEASDPGSGGDFLIRC